MGVEASGPLPKMRFLWFNDLRKTANVSSALNVLCFAIQNNKWRQSVRFRKCRPESRSLFRQIESENTQGHTPTTTWFSIAPAQVPFCRPGSLTCFPLTSCCTFWTRNRVHMLKGATGVIPEKMRGRKKKEWERECLWRNTFFLVSAIWKLKVDKQWRELHPISFLKPEQAHTCHNALGSITTDPVQHAKYCQGLGLINRWPDTEQKCEANKGKGS